MNSETRPVRDDPSEAHGEYPGMDLHLLERIVTKQVRGIRGSTP